jgi:Flp pilus assembly protein TadG
MICRQHHSQRRQAATVVEFAVVAPLVLTLIFGCLEWCLYMFTVNQMQNAAREGARYAVVRTDVYQSFPGADTYLNQNPPDTVSAGTYSVGQVQSYVQGYLNQAGAQVNNLKIDVYKVNGQGQPVDVNGNVITLSQATSSANEGVWSQSSFGQLICVQISGTYMPVIPGLSKIGLAPPVQATSCMGSEGN